MGVQLDRQQSALSQLLDKESAGFRNVSHMLQEDPTLRSER
jgi:hypothetical protein